MEKGCPDGQPFHCRAVIRLNQRKHTVLRRCGPPERLGSSSRMPATAAIDNETLDHLLSVVDDWRNLSGNRELSKPHQTPDRAVMRAGFLDFAHIQLGKNGLPVGPGPACPEHGHRGTPRPAPSRLGLRLAGGR